MPANLNGVNINDISVYRTSTSYEGLNVSDSLIYVTRYLTYTIVYTVYSCAAGIPLLNYNADNDDLIKVQRTVAATSGVTGEFAISVFARGSKLTQNFQYNAGASILETWLEETLDTGDVEVTEGGTCHEVTYNIRWLERGGDQESLVVNGSGLTQEVGNNTDAVVETITDGGVFLRPLTGAMLRIPKKDPQVHNRYTIKIMYIIKIMVGSA